MSAQPGLCRTRAEIPKTDFLTTRLISVTPQSICSDCTRLSHCLSFIFLYHLLVILLFLFEGVSSSSGCLGKAALFYCDTPMAFHIAIMYKHSQELTPGKIFITKVVCVCMCVCADKMKLHQ